MTTDRVTLDLNLADHEPQLLAVVPMSADVSGVRFEHVHGNGLPPPDLITTLGVLLI